MHERVAGRGGGIELARKECVDVYMYIYIHTYISVMPVLGMFPKIL